VVAGTANLVIPVMVMAEMVLLLEKGRAAIDLDAILGTLYSLPAVTVAPLTLEVTLGIRELSVLPDMHDRLIVAEARAREAALISVDRAITASALVNVVW
jgi:PIN domain nuclease of toxin-antitoxin system